MFYILYFQEQNWRTNLKSEIENNISNQVNLALKPLIKELPTIKRAYHKRKVSLQNKFVAIKLF